MINKSKLKEPIDILNIKKRKTSFEEVEKSLSDENALKESLRCLKCKNPPCILGCPVGIKIPEFIDCISKGMISDAYQIISKDSFLPSICGRVCPQETQCEAKCVRGKGGQPVAIGRLERYVADKIKLEHIKSPKKENNLKIAIVGSGPSGLTCAAQLCDLGYQADIFEALHIPGGVLTYGIPAFRLPRDVIDFEIENLKRLGVKIYTNMVIGKTLTIDNLFEMGYSAIYISTGAGLPKLMGIPGEGFRGVYSSNEFLTRINLMHAHESDYDTPIKIPKKAIVVGGGNVAMDVARSAVRLGADKVIVIYRREESEMPARRDEILHAKEEGVEFIFSSTPIEFIGNCGKLEKVKYVNMKPSLDEISGKSRLVPVSGSEKEMEIDTAIIAIGNSANKILVESEKSLEFRPDGRIVADETTAKTSRRYIYAGGDAVSGAATVILAMQAGKQAAYQIHKDLSIRS